MNKVFTINKVIFYIFFFILTICIGIFIGNRINDHSNTIEYGFKDVGKLVTQEYRIRKVKDASQDRKILNILSIPLTNSKLIFSLEIEVLAGIDFTKIEYNEKNEIIKIKLPKAKVYKYYEVKNSFITYIDEESIFNDIKSEERKKLEEELLEEAKTEAINNGILDKAEENAKKIIENMIKSKNKNIIIEWVNEG